MRKLLIFIISFFSFSSSVFAKNIASSLDVNILLDESGTANITEIWNIEDSDFDYFYHEITLLGNLKISKVNVSGLNEDFTLSKQEDVNSYIVDGNKVGFFVKRGQGSYTIKYKIDKFIIKYKDAFGIYIDLLKNNLYKIDLLNININYTNELNSTNSLFQTIGASSTMNLNNGNMSISSYINKENELIIMGKFKNIKFNKYTKISKKYKTVYNNNLKKNSILNRIKLVLIVILGLLIISVIILIISNVIKTKIKKNDILNKIKISNKTKEVKYYENIPCKNNMYEIIFLSNIGKIIKNKSNILGMFIVKWIIENKMVLDISKDKRVLKILDRENNYKDLEARLFDHLLAVSKSGNINSSKIKMYIEKNYNDLDDWYNLLFKDSLIEEINSSKIIVKKRKEEYYLTNELSQEIKNIEGFKNYLMHFNQVSRKTKLDEETYKYFLIYAYLFGIGKSFSEEILRKNKDNIFALKLQSVSQNDDMIKNIYSMIKENVKRSKKIRKKKAKEI